MGPVMTHLRAASTHMSMLLSMRLLPFAVFATLTSSRYRKVLTASVYLVFPAVAFYYGAGGFVVTTALGLAYYLTVSLTINGLSATVESGRLTPSLTLVLIFVVYVLLPGAVLPGRAMTTFLVIGCELALSAYSYCIETSRRGRTRAPLGDCLFFMFVNPTVLYTLRGTQDHTGSGIPRVSWRGGWRAVGGAGLMFLNVAFLRPLLKNMRASDPAMLGGVGGRWVLVGVVSFLTVYAAHSGLASIQIGMMRHLGWKVPERYRYPLLSVNPIDFWRRWNTYIQVWLEAYVFLPIGRRIARKTRRRSGQTAAAVATLGASGVIHDVFAFAGRQRFGDVTAPTQFFLAAAAVLVLWNVPTSMNDRIRAQLRPERLSAFDSLTRFGGRLVLAGVAMTVTATWF